VTKAISVKGVIRKQLTGEYRVILERTHPTTGKRSRKWHTFVGNKDEAHAELARLKLGTSDHAGPSAEKITVLQFLEKWLAHIRSDVSPRTHERYAEISRNNLAPIVGKIPLKKLRPAVIISALEKARVNGRIDHKGGLAPQTVRHMYRVLFQAMAQAVRWHMLSHNPLDLVPLPEVERQQMNTYSLQDTSVLIKAMRETQIFIPMLLALLVGMRRSEISALRWGAIDFEAAQLSVMHNVEQMNGTFRLKQIQSGKQRTVALPRLVAEALLKHRESHAQRLLLSKGKSLSNDHFVCALKNGRMMQPTRITHDWIKTIRETTLPFCRFNDLRHAHAVHLLSSGVHVKVASERLGHSSVGVTAQLYAHAMLGAQEDAVSRLDFALHQAMAGEI
jgi:integrase